MKDIFWNIQEWYDNQPDNLQNIISPIFHILVAFTFLLLGITIIFFFLKVAILIFTFINPFGLTE